MFLSWWRSLVKLANPKNENSKSLRRRRVPRKFRSAMRVEQLEDRMVPTGTANLFLNVGTPAVAAQNDHRDARHDRASFYRFRRDQYGSRSGYGHAVGNSNLLVQQYERRSLHVCVGFQWNHGGGIPNIPSGHSWFKRSDGLER